MRLFGLLVGLFSALLLVPSAGAQCEAPLIGPGAQDVQGRKPDVPVGFAAEDWKWQFATGRAVLGTTLPVAAGSAGVRIGEGTAPGLRVAGGLLLGTGVAVGPSLGQWSLGGRCTTQSLLPTALRIGGIAEIIWVGSLVRDAEGFGSVVLLLLTIPGFVALSVGMAWAFGATPRIAVDPEERRRDGPELFDGLSARLRPVSAAGRPGLQLRLRW